MDYTWRELLLQELHDKAGAAAQPDEVSLIDRLITAASRTFDCYCTGTLEPDSSDYFKTETKTNEEVNGQMDNKGGIICYPHKPFITTLTDFNYRTRPYDSWVNVDVTRIQIDGSKLIVYPQSPTKKSQRCFIKLTYAGGLGTLSVAAATPPATTRVITCTLPEELVECVTLLAARFYKESETGLNDVMGVSEMGQLIYTKAYPVRFREMAQSFVRQVGWRYVA